MFPAVGADRIAKNGDTANKASTVSPAQKTYSYRGLDWNLQCGGACRQAQRPIHCCRSY